LSEQRTEESDVTEAPKAKASDIVKLGLALAEVCQLVEGLTDSVIRIEERVSALERDRQEKLRS
jgi:hypothetical protein